MPFYRHILTGIAVLHLPDIIRCRTSSSEIFHPLPLPPRLSHPEISPRCKDMYSVDGWSYSRICDGRSISMRTCQGGLGSLNTWNLHQLSGVRLLGCWVQHFRGFCHNAAPYLGAEGLEFEHQEEACSDISVCSWILVSALIPPHSLRFR